MKLEVGMYVRTKYNGIFKINGFHSTIYDDYIATHNDLVRKKEIIKASHNIIDLIEVGDYVNGMLVTKSTWNYQNIDFIQVDTLDSWGWGVGTMPVTEIKSIVTSQQFESMQYKVD